MHHQVIFSPSPGVAGSGSKSKNSKMEPLGKGQRRRAGTTRVLLRTKWTPSGSPFGRSPKDLSKMVPPLYSNIRACSRNSVGYKAIRSWGKSYPKSEIRKSRGCTEMLCWPSEGLFSAGMVGRISGKVSLRKKTNGERPNCTHFCFPIETAENVENFKTLFFGRHGFSAW